MKLLRTPAALYTTILLLSASNVLAKGAGTSGGLTLVEPFGAKPAALGEAYSAMTNDISAFGYNPASLKSLNSGQASFMYQKGLAEDSYGHFMIGSPMKNGSLGLSVGYYNGGEIDLYDGTTERTVTAQKDMSMALGYATQVGNMSVGITGKYLSSELVESAKATAYAADFGMQMPVTSRLSIGAAVQNIGTKLTFVSEGDSLPRIARAGASMLMVPGKYQTMLLLDAPYFMNEAELRPSVGVETMVGPLAIRGGYRKGSGAQELSFGTGFMLGSSSLDYAFGLVDQLEARHRISLSMKFGQGGVGNRLIVKKQAQPTEREVASVQKQKKPAVQEKEEMKEVWMMEPAEKKHTLGSLDKGGVVSSRRREVYTVKPGDTLGKIAKKMYGDAREWKKIYSANAHLLDDTHNIEVGQKIVLP